MENEVMLSKEEFVSIVDRLKAAKELVNDISELFARSADKVEYGFSNGACLQISHETIVINLLQKIMHDEEQFISYFIYELDYGKYYSPGLVTDGEGEIDLSTAGQLYDYLLRMM